MSWGKLVSAPLIALIYLYRWTISPLLGMNCRFAPSCSCYAQEALKLHGPIKGSWLTLRRLLMCHPWGPWGYDPVPPKDEDRTKTERTA